jgi:hypothetical protein
MGIVMGMGAIKSLLVLCLIGVLIGMPAHAGDDLLSEDALGEDWLSEEFDDGEDLFAGEGFSALGIIAAQNKPLQLSVEHTLAVNPKASYQRTNHVSDVRVLTEASVGLLGYAQIEVKAMQYWQGSPNKPAKGDFSLLEVEQMMLQYSLAEASIKLGRYILSWGEVEGAGVLDVINPAPDPISGATGFTPQWLLTGSYYMPSAQVSGFVGLDPSVNALPDVVLTSSVEKEWGVKYGHTGAGSDWAVYAAHMVPNSAVLNLATTTTTASAKAYQLIGYSWNRAIDDDLVKFDVAYKRGLEHNHGVTGLILANRLDMAAGLELNDGDRQWSASVTAQHWLDYQSSYLTPALPPVASNQADVTYSLGVNDNFKNDEFSWSLMHIGTPTGSLRALTGVLTWSPTDQWQSSLSTAVMAAKSDTAYALLDGTQRLTFKVRFSY